MAFLNDITLGQYYPGNSLLHRLDPRSKLCVGLILMTGLLLTHKLSLTLFFLGICLFGLTISGIPAQRILRNLKPFFWLFLITLAIHLLTTKGHEVIRIPLIGVGVTKEGFLNGLSYSLRLGLLVIFATFLTMTTAPIELTDGLEKIFSPLRRFKVPVHEFVLMMTLSLRFLPILILEAQKIKNAQLSRGVSLDGNLLQRVKNIAPMILPLFVSAIRRAEELAVAMEARHYVGGDGRTSFRKLQFEQRDFGMIAFAIAAFCAIVLWK
ncbi:MAG: energy-coupling factor transporter transmembrane component T family protein [bacterium]